MNKTILCMMCLATLGAVAEPGLLPGQEAALRAFARGEEAPEWTPLTPGQVRAIHDRSEAYWDLFHKHHLPHGFYADVWWTDRERTSVYRLEGLGDSACWHGHYVAALVFRHKVTGNEAVLGEIRKNLDRFDLLTRISGRDGYVARYAGPVDDEGYKAYYSVYGKGEDPERPGFGRRAWRGVPPWEDLAWLGFSSRDTYDGTLFALATVWANTEDAESRQKVKDIAERVGDRLIADKWTLPDGKGNVTPGNTMFNMGYMRLLLAVNPEKYAGLREECSKITRALVERPDIYPMDFGDYFANNLRFIRMYSNCMLESDPEQKALLQGAMRAMAEKALTHLNPHFSALTLLAADTDDPRHVAMVQGMLADFPDPPKFGHRVEADPSLEMADAKHARFALLTRERIPGDFLWRMSPNQAVNDFPADVDSFEYPGADMFLPYWAGRLAGAIPAP